MGQVRDRIGSDGDPRAHETKHDAATLGARTGAATAQFRSLVNVFGSQRFVLLGGHIKVIDEQVNFHDVLAEFWFNHFNVDTSVIGPLSALGDGSYEMAIRSRMHGRFSDLLETVVLHPVMSAYLNNQKNHFVPATGSASNQNLGREILELHSLGVPPGSRNGYNQTDVEQSALLLTGMGGGSPSPTLSAPDFMVKGDKSLAQIAPVVMGHRFCLGEIAPKKSSESCSVPPRGRAQLTRERIQTRFRAYIDFLANHHITRRSICRKLTRHFLNPDFQPGQVSNTPRDEVAVSAVMNRCHMAWGEGGDLQAIYLSLLTSPEIWNRSNFKRRPKNPLQLVTSGARFAGYSITDLLPSQGSWTDVEQNRVVRFAATLHAEISRLGLNYRYWPTPDGYPTHGVSWGGAGYLTRWTISSFRLVNLLESVDPSLRLGHMGVRGPAGFAGSAEDQISKLPTVHDRVAFVASRVGWARPLGFNPVTLSTYQSALDPLNKKAIRQDLGVGGLTPVPLKTGLNLELNSVWFLFR